MSKIAVVYWSGTGNTEAMAAAVASGATAAGAEVSTFTASDFNSGMVSDYDAIAFGCPAMGAEQLEDGEFEPMYEECKPALSGKKIALFGSYDWGDGEWMRIWQEDAESIGASLVADGLICNNEPDSAALSQCETLGKSLA